MKKLTIIAICVITLALFCGCSAKGGITDKVVKNYDSQIELFDDSDIDSAMNVVIDYFGENYDGCTLLSLSVNEKETIYLQKNDSAEKSDYIALSSSFRVGKMGYDNFTANETYDLWCWYLQKNNDKWEIINIGYP